MAHPRKPPPCGDFHNSNVFSTIGTFRLYFSVSCPRAGCPEVVEAYFHTRPQ